METLKDQEQIENLAENLAAVMHRQKMSQEQLEAESGVDQAAISRMLNAKGNPAVTKVWRVAVALETSMDRLLSQPAKKILAKTS
jgi:transcriptional regulator with XRE-family HTH domain